MSDELPSVVPYHEVKSRQRTSHSKRVYVSLLLEVILPWAARAYTKVLGNTRIFKEIGPGVTMNNK